MTRLHLLFLSLLVIPVTLAAAEPEPDFSAELPRIPPVEPANALGTFKLAPGFRIDQVAAEPLVNDPVALCFDENARMYVVEMRDYSEQDKEKLGRVRLLEDADGDGRFDKSTVFVEGLSWPTAVTCYDGGVFIGDAPDIVYCKDTDGDGRADVRRTVFTGFGRSNVQGLLNSLCWSLDNRVEGAASSSGGEVRRADDPKARSVSVGGRDFSFDPRRLDLTPTSGGGQNGMSFDNWGRKFVCSNSNHIQQVMYEDRYIARNPYLTAPAPRVSIAADGPAAEVYRASPDEPWRVVRTRLRVSGAVKGPVEGGGRVSGYFTGASGIVMYRGNAAPQLTGMAAVGEACGGLVHRKKLEPRGLELVARRVDLKSELVASTDLWFRPVQLFNAPDGGLYIADMYREVIEHPASLPPMIKKHLDLTSGRDRGRIYRIVADGFHQPNVPKLGKASTAELVATLAHPNAWHRETAARLLYERQDRTAIEPLEQLAKSSASELGRLHALYALGGLDALSEAVLRARLDDSQAHVRAHAVRLSERLPKPSAEFQTRLFKLAGDDDAGVRYQLAFTLGEFSGPERNQALASIVRRDGTNAWVRLAVLSSLSTGGGDIFRLLLAERSLRASAAGRDVLAALSQQVGLRGQRDELAAVLSGLDQLSADEDALARLIAANLSTGLSRAGHPLDKILAGTQGSKAKLLVAQILASARNSARDSSKSTAARISAIQMLVLDSFKNVSSIFADLLDNRQGQDIQQAALTTLARFKEPEAASLVIEAWSGLSPRLRVAAADALLARRDRVQALLAAVSQGKIAAGELEPDRVQLLLTYPDTSIRDEAKRLLGSARLGRRQDVVDSYRSALSLKGDAARGKLTFQKICAACHKAEGVGHEVGPNLVTVKNRGAEFVLLNVLDPSREVNPQYTNYLAVTDDGRTVSGMIAAETATSITLRRAEGASDTILRIQLEELRSTGLSIMPEGLEKQIDRQAMADVIAYILSIN